MHLQLETETNVVRVGVHACACGCTCMCVGDQMSPIKIRKQQKKQIVFSAFLFSYISLKYF